MFIFIACFYFFFFDVQRYEKKSELTKLEFLFLLIKMSKNLIDTNNC